ncbi:MAG: archaemetzincin family Zn-dependent metalloprotease [Dehalococcoidales bacterium]|nr:MAG: archaemetzincin family Zn-dependent metalloprotease [Dehalococcoidales bacterium]
MGRIILVLMSRIDESPLTKIKESLERTFNRSVDVRVRTGTLGHAYDTCRSQYRSPRLLLRLRKMKKDHSDKIVGLVDVDLYSPGFDFIFGEADVSAGVGTVSLYRLRPDVYGESPDSTLFSERSIKEATHELGHLYHLGHCHNPECVMHFSTSLSDVDRKTSEFCAKCLYQLRHN